MVGSEEKEADSGVLHQGGVVGCECVMEKGGALKRSLEGVVANTKRRTPKCSGLGQTKPKIAELQASLNWFAAILGHDEDFGGLLRGGCFFECFLGDLGLKAPQNHN